ncbi:MAG: hypothetical protein M1820_000974 [Bogoriella megaspora]|nr:MAG: hypothetical protein M1820_000974 [Bogoriella megaspora]
MANDQDADKFWLDTRTDWTSYHNRYPVWELMMKYVTKPDPQVLEVGAWEGRSCIFFLQKLCSQGGDLTCIDHFDLLQTDNGIERYRRTHHNLSLAGGSFRILPRYSVDGLFTLTQEALDVAEPGYDWIYIDGSHESDDVLLDAELAWRLARPGCVFIFDDYRWEKESEQSKHHPKPGVDAFMQLHAGQFDVLHGMGQGDYQMILHKKVPLRIGYEVPGHGYQVEKHLSSDIQIGLHCNSKSVQLAIDTIQSTSVTNMDKGSFIICDCGLTQSDKETIRRSLPTEQNLRVNFVDLPTDSLTKDLGYEYGKIDLIPMLTARRAMLVEPGQPLPRDIVKLWRQGLSGCALAARLHDTLPEGHDGILINWYFSDDFLVADVQKLQESLESIHFWAREFRDSQYPRQDALNKMFRFRWKQFPPSTPPTMTTK